MFLDSRRHLLRVYRWAGYSELLTPLFALPSLRYDEGYFMAIAAVADIVIGMFIFPN